MHDWFQGFHGSERVVASMLELFERRPDVHTFHAARELLPKDLAGAIVGESRLSRLPGVRQRGHDPGRWRLLLPYMPHYFASLDLDGYELVISSSHACSAHVQPPDSAFHLCYCYTPMRYLWMPETDSGRVTGVQGAFLRGLRGRLRARDLEASARPDAYVAISTAVAERVQSVYGREATVIHPPVAIDDFEPWEGGPRAGFLWVHRLVGYKHPLEVAEAFRGLPHLELTMVGVGPLEGELRRLLPPNVTLHGWLPREELARLYARSSAFVHVGEEDFGISMVEALASGLPVLSLNRGGARDIVEPGVNGVHVGDPGDVEELRAGIQAIASRSWDRAVLRASVERFSEAAFHQRLASFLGEHGVV